MASLNSDRNPHATVIDFPTSLGEGSSSLDDYVENSTRQLDALTELVGRGETIDSASRDWILNQVDFIIGAVGSEHLELTDQTRSNLLQLLLALANLNEQIRRQTSLGL